MIGAVIQARMGSSRLPGKTLMPIETRPLLGHLVDRIRASKHVEKVIIATSERKRDDPIVEFARQERLPVFRGDETDVLDRFYKAAKKLAIDTVVRVTPDCPMLDPDVTDMVIERFLAGGFDYVSNAIEPSFPDGLDSEIFAFDVLETAWREAELPSEREHVTPFVINRPGRFSLSNVRKEGKNLSRMRWTVDTQDDLKFARAVFSHLYFENPIFHMNDVLRLLDRHPALLEINQGIERNEGYRLSLEKDKNCFKP